MKKFTNVIILLPPDFRCGLGSIKKRIPDIVVVNENDEVTTARLYGDSLFCYSVDTFEFRSNWKDSDVVGFIFAAGHHVPFEMLLVGE